MGIKEIFKKENTISGSKEIQNYYEEYKDYLWDSTISKYKTVSFNLSAVGWKKLIRENLAGLIEKELGMYQIKDYCFADDYSDGRRRVLSFFMLNDAYATFQWGWNFDYIPKISGGKAVYCRTDKSIYTHTFEVSKEFYHTETKEQDKTRFSDSKREKVIVTRYGIDAKDVNRGLSEMIQHHIDVFYYLLPLIKQYYSDTDSYAGLLARIEKENSKLYYRFVNAGNFVVKAFVERYLGMSQQAGEDFNAIEFESDKIKEEYYRKFMKVSEKATEKISVASRY